MLWIRQISRLISLVLLLCAAMLSHSRAQEDEGVDRWRFTDHGEELLSLLRASSGSTDADGLFAFDCHRHSGKVSVMFVLRGDDLADVGRVISNGNYPHFEMLPDETNFYFKIEMNDFYGWTMTFEENASSKFLEFFGQTGQIRYKLGQTVREDGIPAGTEVISSFLTECRKL